jgi:AcrR family transcriptional regulator
MSTTGASSPRIERILSATREMVHQGGTRGITIAEIARRAGVGKGTLYQYWATKEDLLAELLAHDLLGVLDDVESAVRADHDLIAPHRLLVVMEETLSAHPFAIAVNRHDRDLLGMILEHPALQEVSTVLGPLAVLQQVIPVLRRHGLVREDLPVHIQVHAVSALIHGLQAVGEREPLEELLPQSDALAVLEASTATLLEPQDLPDADSAAVESIAALRAARRAAVEILRRHGLGLSGAV